MNQPPRPSPSGTIGWPKATASDSPPNPTDLRSPTESSHNSTHSTSGSTLGGQKQYGLTNRRWLTRSYFKVRFASSK
jgi:hypothetical protein